MHCEPTIHSESNRVSSSATNKKILNNNDNKEELGVPHIPSREFLIGSGQSLEAAAEQAVARVHDLASTQVMSLSQKIGNYHAGCSAFAEIVPVTGRFRLKSLLNGIEEAADGLRMQAGKPQLLSRTLNDLRANLKSLVALLQKC